MGRLQHCNRSSIFSWPKPPSTAVWTATQVRSSSHQVQRVLDLGVWNAWQSPRRTSRTRRRFGPERWGVLCLVRWVRPTPSCARSRAQSTPRDPTDSASAPTESLPSPPGLLPGLSHCMRAGSLSRSVTLIVVYYPYPKNTSKKFTLEFY